MFGEFEKISEPMENGLDQAGQEPESFDEAPSMDSLRERMDEMFPMPHDAGEDNEQAAWRGQDTEEAYPKEITLDDGTVVELPVLSEPMPHGLAESDGEAERPFEQKADDRGETYSIDGKLLPDTAYELNGNTYETDENARIIKGHAEPELTPENPRDNKAQQEVGGSDRRAGDQGGHLVGRDMGGDGGIGNLVAMDSRINQSDYKRMENDIKNAVREGENVQMDFEISYSGDSERPDTLENIVTVDGKKTIYRFDNNLDGALRDRAREIGKEEGAEAVDSVLEETGGEISSIKEIYDQKNDLVEAIVNVTYTGEDEKPKRTKVVFDNP